MGLDRRQFLGAIAKPAAAASMVISNPTLMANAFSKIGKHLVIQNRLLKMNHTGERFNKDIPLIGE